MTASKQVCYMLRGVFFLSSLLTVLYTFKPWLTLGASGVALSVHVCITITAWGRIVRVCTELEEREVPTCSNPCKRPRRLEAADGNAGDQSSGELPIKSVRRNDDD
ncbi:hypothetical protein K504DRAFT_512307 [Pleomassaria siparia CBS 279.74]|uniref:Uncharacterized protein n=1 Tax=Pleomassaria siparia CBS 279.74 TaxID=1314801 RepID=A0A6G1K357_9PLEO|nr:hypothetical protein K504DRAFT_512307 [Pleomassaria siparia CBS 279.74]